LSCTDKIRRTDQQKLGILLGRARYLPGLEPARDTVEVKGMVALAPATQTSNYFSQVHGRYQKLHQEINPTYTRMLKGHSTQRIVPAPPSTTTTPSIMCSEVEKGMFTMQRCTPRWLLTPGVPGTQCLQRNQSPVASPDVLFRAIGLRIINKTLTPARNLQGSRKRSRRCSPAYLRIRVGAHRGP
jgi:hypothetical protein